MMIRMPEMFERCCMAYLISFFLLAAGAINSAEAATPPLRPIRAVLLLHGMNSDLKTWNKLVNNSAGFDGQCANTRDSKFLTGPLKPNSDGIYCMRFTFGTNDRNSLSAKGLDKKTCSQSGGCSGDYSTFDGLGKEVATAISRIRGRLGARAQIVLLGHSRGGLAARSFLQGANPDSLKKNVVGLITTGTPHSGTPLGRYYAYMEKNCLPESKYDGIFDFSDCANDWDFINSLFIKDVGGLDLKAPTIGFLSEISPAVKALNNPAIGLPKLQLTQLSYGSIKFGCLGGDVVDKEKGCGFDIFGKILRYKPSKAGLNAVLAGRLRDRLQGDGIVPVASQKMSLVKGWPLTVKDYAKQKRVHVVETEQILDLTTALGNMYQRLGWKP